MSHNGDRAARLCAVLVLTVHPPRVTDWRAYAQGAKMVCQVWNCGRMSHESYQPDRRAPPAPSALACPQGVCFTVEGPKVWSCGRVSEKTERRFHFFFLPPLSHVLAASRRGIQKRAVLTARFFKRVIATLLYAFARSDWQPYPVPREMTAGEIKNCVKQFRQGALNSIKAGFDGVEVRNQMVI